MKKNLVFGMVLLILLSIFPMGIAGSGGGKIRVIIGFEESPDPELVKSFGGEVRYVYTVIPAISARMPEENISKIMRSKGVVYVEADYRVYAVQQELPWGVDRIDAEKVHSYNKGSGIKIAIIDTGIDYKHPDLDENFHGGYDFVNNDDDPMDDNGHGTHVAGIVAAEDNDFGVVGVAPEAHLYAVKVLDNSGSGYVSDVIAGIEWSIENGMQIISMSLGSKSDSTALHDACDTAYENGILLVAAAGNEGNPPGKGDNVLYPAKYSSVIAVAATDINDERASWSSTGPDVELAAPGVDIKSTLLGGGYGEKSGTSMACPHVSGVAALIMVSYPNLTNVEVRQRLRDTADDLGPAGFDEKYGYGLVDADEAAPKTDVHDVAVTDISAPSWVVKGDVASINITTSNEGTYEETITVTLTDATDGVTIGSEVVILTAGSSETLTFSWNSTEATIGDHILNASVSIVEGEIDIADNSKTTTVTVKEPSHDVAVIAIDAPSEVGEGDIVDVDVDVTNEGTYEEIFTLSLTDITDSLLIGSKTVTLAAGESQTIRFTWNTTGSSLGNHTLRAEASVVEGETDTADNFKELIVSVVEKAALTMYVESITFGSKKSGPNIFLYTYVKVVDGNGNPLEDVRVEMTLEWDKDGDGKFDDSWNFAGKTDSTGIVKFTLIKAPSGYYKATITNLILTDYEWDKTRGVISASCQLLDDGTIIQS